MYSRNQSCGTTSAQSLHNGLALFQFFACFESPEASLNFNSGIGGDFLLLSHQESPESRLYLGGTTILHGFATILGARMLILAAGTGISRIVLVFHEAVVLWTLSLIPPGMGILAGSMDLFAHTVATKSGLNLNGRTLFGLQGRC